MPVEIGDLVVSAHLRARPGAPPSKHALQRLKEEIIAACLEEISKTMQRLKER